MRFYRLIASGLGSGFVPIAPGTAGAVVGVLIVFFYNYIIGIFGFGGMFVVELNLIAILFVSLLGYISVKKVHKEWKHDSPKIVIDEIIGVYIAVFALPFEWQYYLFGFILFRFFDIAKPLFIRKIDKKGGAWSVILDDVLAGIYANIILQIVNYYNLM